MMANLIKFISKIFLFIFVVFIVAFIIWSRLIKEISFDIINTICILIICTIFITNLYVNLVSKRNNIDTVENVYLTNIPNIPLLWFNSRGVHHKLKSYYYITKRFTNTTKVTNTALRSGANSNSSAITTKVATTATPFRSTNTNNINRPNTTNFTNNKFSPSESNKPQFLKQVDSLAKKVHDSNVSPTVGVQKNPLKWLEPVIYKKAENSKVMAYEDTKEFKTSGSAKLTPKGLAIFREVRKSRESLVEAPTSGTTTQREAIKYEVGLLKINQDTVILTAEQTHLLVVYSINNEGQRIGLGYLTSKNEGNIVQLSKDQPLSGNKDKAQNLAVFDKPLRVDKEYFNSHTEGTAYIQGYLREMEEVREISVSKQHRVYDGNGVSLADLSYVAHKNLIEEKSKFDSAEIRKSKLNTQQLALEQDVEHVRQNYEHKIRIDFSNFDEEDFKQ
jgi:hypothetical protein